MAHVIQCDNPECDESVEWDEIDDAPIGWWWLEQRVEDEAHTVSYWLHELACVRAFAQMHASAHTSAARPDED